MKPWQKEVILALAMMAVAFLVSAAQAASGISRPETPTAFIVGPLWLCLRYSWISRHKPKQPKAWQYPWEKPEGPVK